MNRVLWLVVTGVAISACADRPTRAEMVDAVSLITPEEEVTDFDECLADLLLESDLSNRYLDQVATRPREVVAEYLTVDGIEDRKFIGALVAAEEVCR